VVAISSNLSTAAPKVENYCRDAILKNMNICTQLQHCCIYRMFDARNYITNMKNILLTPIVIIALLSCKKDVDTTSPMINLYQINGEDHIAIGEAGSEINISAELSDDKNLSQFKIDIHDNFDGHNHGKSAYSWAHVELINVSGVFAAVNKSIPVPIDITAGPYHAVARLVDAEGNESDFKEIELILKNGSEPSISISNPDFSMPVNWTKGSTYAVQGFTEDPDGIAEIILTVGEAVHEVHKTFDGTIYSFDVDLGGTVNTFDFDQDGNIEIGIPLEAESGEYYFWMTVKDTKGNIAVFKKEVNIL
jgi:hypothetical protein